MKIPIPFVGWMEEDGSAEELLDFLKSELSGKATTYTFGYERMKEIVEAMDKLKQERDFYKNGFEGGDQEATKGCSQVSN
jgi:hypothetical protein